MSFATRFHLNHSAAFWELVELHEPDFRELDGRLRKAKTSCLFGRMKSEAGRRRPEVGNQSWEVGSRKMMVGERRAGEYPLQPLALYSKTETRVSRLIW